MTCKNACLQLIQSSAALQRVARPYEKGFRYCRRCEYYIKTEKSHCQCCGLHMRFTPAVRMPRSSADLLTRL